MEQGIPDKFKEESYLFPGALAVILLPAGGFLLWSIIRRFSLPEVFLLCIIVSIPFLSGKMTVIVRNGELFDHDREPEKLLRAPGKGK